MLQITFFIFSVLTLGENSNCRKLHKIVIFIRESSHIFIKRILLRLLVTNSRINYFVNCGRLYFKALKFQLLKTNYNYSKTEFELLKKKSFPRLVHTLSVLIYTFVLKRFYYIIFCTLIEQELSILKN